MTEECNCPACAAARALRKFKIAKSSEEHMCYYCGDEDTVLIPVCKGCIDSFNKYFDKTEEM